MAFAVEFALDGAVGILVPNLGHGIDSDVAAIKTMRCCPFGIEPAILVFLCHAVVVLDERDGQPLEIIAFFPLGLGRVAKFGEKFAKRRAHERIAPNSVTYGFGGLWHMPARLAKHVEPEIRRLDKADRIQRSRGDARHK